MSEYYVVVSENTKVRVSRAPGIRKSCYPTRASAQAAATRCMGLSSDPDHSNLRVMTGSQYHAQVPKVTVKNLLSGKDVVISAEEAGGPCDPSTERYHSM